MEEAYLEEKTIRAAEAIVRLSTPEELVLLLCDDEGAWGNPALEPFRDLAYGEPVLLNSMLLEGIWIKTGDPKQVFEVLLQRGCAESFDLCSEYSEAFNRLPWFGQMWHDVPSRKQVELILFVFDLGGTDEVDPAFTVDESFWLACAMRDEMKLPAGSRSRIVWELLTPAFYGHDYDEEGDRGIIKRGLQLLGELIAESE